MPATKEEMQERAQLVRIHESNCNLDHPTPDELNYRIAVMKRLGVLFGLREMRSTQITGPVPPAQQQRKPPGNDKVSRPAAE